MNLEKIAAELLDLQRLIAEAEEEAETLKNQLKQALGDKEEMRAGAYKISWKIVKSNRLDGKALKQDLPDIAERYTRETTARRFTVK
ncbi:MAG: hypothetical protein LUD47_03070 [Clostridia bacterium]|nr:hypothetical protein [Clostridia bacterium]